MESLDSTHVVASIAKARSHNGISKRTQKWKTSMGKFSEIGDKHEGEEMEQYYCLPNLNKCEGGCSACSNKVILT
jgi:hypothetical protein